MFTTLRRVLLCCAIAAASQSIEARGDDTAESAREILRQYGGAVVNVKLVIRERWSMGASGSDDSESTTDIVGTVVRPDGLLIAAYSDVDPSVDYDSMFSDMSDDDFNMDISTEVTSIEIRLETGEEVDAEQILIDKDLDIAVIRPKEALTAPHSFVDLTKVGAADTMDELVTLSRLGKVLNRESSVSVSRVHAVVKKPRVYYVLESMETGTPVFTLEGACVGITVTRRMKAVSTSDYDFDNIAYVVVSAEDIQEIVTQAIDRPDDKSTD